MALRKSMALMPRRADAAEVRMRSASFGVQVLGHVVEVEGEDLLVLGALAVLMSSMALRSSSRRKGTGARPRWCRGRSVSMPTPVRSRLAALVGEGRRRLLACPAPGESPGWTSRPPPCAAGRRPRARASPATSSRTSTSPGPGKERTRMPRSRARKRTRGRMRARGTGLPRPGARARRSASRWARSSSGPPGARPGTRTS